MTFDFSLIPNATLFIMMLALGMGLRAEDFLHLSKKPVAVAAGLFGQFFLLPTCALIVILLFNLPAYIAVGFLLIAACPGGAVSNMFTRYAHGDVALSVSLTAFSSVISPLSVPLILGLSLSYWQLELRTIQLSFSSMFITLLLTTALPIFMGMIWRYLATNSAIKWSGRLLAASTTILMILIIGLGIGTAKSQVNFHTMFSLVLPAACAFLAMLVLSLWTTCKTLKLSHASNRSVLIETVIQNINLSLLVVMSFLEEPRYLAPTLIYLPLMLLFASGVILFQKAQRLSSRAGEAP
ncbi:bile acid:sodium symporter family protein [Aurantivibrio plasticivorans]